MIQPLPVSIRFSVPGNPVGKQRAGRNLATGKTFTPKKTARYQNDIAWAATAALQRVDRTRWPATTPVYLDVWIYYANNNIKKPDPDNVVKALQDALAGILFVKRESGKADDFRVWPRVQHVTEKDANPRVDCLVSYV